jgi:benzoate 4-monooxygenase
VHLAGIAIAAVEKRLADPSASDRGDLLSKLQEGKDEKGKPMGKEELTSEALTQLIVGNDTISKYTLSVGLSYHTPTRPLAHLVASHTTYLVRYPEAQRKLQAELDATLGPEEGVIH